MITLPMFRKDSATESGWEAVSAGAAVPFLGPQLEHAETCSNAEATREQHACVHAVVCGMKLADPSITGETRVLTASQSRADIFSTAAVPGRNAALDVCVPSSVAAAARGDAFGRELWRNRNETQMSAKSHHRKWKHEIQIAFLRRRAAMARAVLPNPSARAEWLFAGIIDRALHHWGLVLTLDSGPGDHDLDVSETDTAIPDDDDDIVSLRV